MDGRAFGRAHDSDFGGGGEEPSPGMEERDQYGHLARLMENPLMASVGRGDIHWSRALGAVVGSTRWKAGDTPMTSDGALHVLHQRARPFWESLSRRRVRGVELRVRAGDRRPTAAWSPSRTCDDVGLGSKGLLWVPYAASVLVRALEGKGEGELPGSWASSPEWKVGELREIRSLRAG